MPELDDIPIVGRMGNKVGPLPAWAWAAIPAAGYVAWSYYRASQGDSDVVLDDSTGGAAGTDAADYGVNTGGVSLPGYGSTPNGSSNNPLPDMPRFDNQAWFKQATNYLIGEGVAAMDVVTALSAYIYGNPTVITQVQFNALQKAITKIGAAPDGGYIPTIKPPTTTPPPAPVIKVPEAPTTVSASLPASTTTRIAWNVPQQNGGSAIIGYKVELWHYDATAKVWKINASKLTLAATRSVDFYTPARNHYFLGRVYARNVKGYGPYGSSQSVRTAAK